MGRRGERLIALAVLGAVLLNYPVLSLFAIDGELFGLPVLPLYFVTVWAALIGAAALIQQPNPRRRR